MSAISRRTALLGLLALGGCGLPSPQATVRIAAGETGGFYVEFARLLAAELTATEPGLRVEVVETQGSVMNIGRVTTGGADLALCLADALAAARAGEHPFGTAVPLPALGRVYENYMQLVVRADSPIRTLPDLAGRAVSLGAEGSGAALFGDRLLSAAGVAVTVDRHPLAGAVTALRTDRVAALLWSGGLPTPALADLDASIGIRLLDLSPYLTTLRTRHGAVYEQVTVPGRTYSSPDAVTTIGVPNLLVPAPDLPDAVIRATVHTLVDHATRLVPQQALGTQYLDVRSLIDTTPAPLHPTAAETYRDLRG
ncbi:TAXI family TRAP transporter solute-binding subunit [Actinokineospora sp. NBRC 105648]|uniref:TAXI family TRAP transporter solute-binding subunit n=1 Tax=Actinokineospora sp. NBRC 105648 TaxID=3032206 RepID=UPI0024A15784|nr:TAXI family TRAP transporter solute-binding subunit [Actinokineospora sp. NBRC 105648]GLZ39757.1 C4-dicarboxylate ABC transporter substrate-binding protein [Actinokineospora sp. NBRC 105648]